MIKKNKKKKASECQLKKFVYEGILVILLYF